MTRNSLQKQEKDTGVKGILPLVCLPLWGREGVTLITLFIQYITLNTNSGSCSFLGNQNLLYGFFLLKQML